MDKVESKKPRTTKNEPKLAGGTRKGATTTYQGKDGRHYTTLGAMKQANRRYESKARKAREANPSAAKGSQAERDAVRIREEKLGK